MVDKRIMSSVTRQRGSAITWHKEPAEVRQKYSLNRLYALARQHIQEAEIKQEKDICDYTIEIHGTADEYSSVIMDNDCTHSKASADPLDSNDAPPAKLRIIQYVMDLAESSTSKFSCGIPCHANFRAGDSDLELQRMVDEIPIAMDMTQSLETAPTDDSTLDASLLKRFQWSLPSTVHNDDTEDDDDDDFNEEELDEDTLSSFVTDSVGSMDEENV